MTGYYAGARYPDWRGGLAATIFAVCLCVVAMAMLGISAGISMLVGEGLFPLVTLGVIALGLQLVKRW